MATTTANIHWVRLIGYTTFTRTCPRVLCTAPSSPRASGARSKASPSVSVLGSRPQERQVAGFERLDGRLSAGARGRWADLRARWLAGCGSRGLIVSPALVSRFGGFAGPRFQGLIVSKPSFSGFDSLTGWAGGT